MENMNFVEINTAEGSLLLTKAQYTAVADYVRKADRLQYAKNVLINNLTCSDSNLGNLEDYIVFDEERLNAFADTLNDKVESDQGEKEYFAVRELIKQSNLGVYRIISNQGSDEEQEDEAVLPKELAENMLDQGNDLTICSTDGDYLYLAVTYIDEVQYVGPYEKN